MAFPELHDSPISYFTQARGVAVTGGDRMSWEHTLATSEHSKNRMILRLKEVIWWKNPMYDFVATNDDKSLRIASIFRLYGPTIMLINNVFHIQRTIGRYHYNMCYATDGDADKAVLREIMTTSIMDMESVSNGHCLKRKLKENLESVGIVEEINWKDTLTTLLCRQTCIGGVLTGEQLTAELFYRRPVIPINAAIPVGQEPGIPLGDALKVVESSNLAVVR